MLRNFIEGYYNNQRILKEKSCWMSAAGVLLVIGVILLATTFIYNVA